MQAKQTTPHDNEAEDALAGAALLDNSLFLSLGVRPGDFYRRPLQALWREGQRLAGAGSAVDQITISEEALREIGGAAKLVEWLAACPSVARAGDYAGIVKGKKEQRRFLKAADWLGKGAFKEDSQERRRLAAMARRRLEEIEREWRVDTGGEPIGMQTADEILAGDFPDAVWVVPGLLPAGLTVLAGKPKIGKSWLGLQFALAVASGGRTLGREVEQGAVCYLALEDPPRRLRSRMIVQMWPKGLPVDFLCLGEFMEKMGDLRDGGGDRLAAQMARKAYRLVVIDTLSRSILGQQDRVEEMTAALTPIHMMAHKFNCAVVMVDHHRKGFGTDPDVIVDILGSVAKGAVADTVLGLYRERGKSGTRLMAIGRELDEELTLLLKWDRPLGCWQLEGEVGELRLTEARQLVLDALEERGVSSAREIQDAVGRNKGSLSRDLQDLVTAGLVRKGGGRPASYELVGG